MLLKLPIICARVLCMPLDFPDGMHSAGHLLILSCLVTFPTAAALCMPLEYPGGMHSAMHLLILLCLITAACLVVQLGATDVRLAGLEAQRFKLQADATDADGRCQGLRDQISAQTLLFSCPAAYWVSHIVQEETLKKDLASALAAKYKLLLATSRLSTMSAPDLPALGAMRVMHMRS
eukprot:33246-Pelagomonas_calceolata.AAC.2